MRVPSFVHSFEGYKCRSEEKITFEGTFEFSQAVPRQVGVTALKPLDEKGSLTKPALNKRQRVTNTGHKISSLKSSQASSCGSFCSKNRPNYEGFALQVAANKQKQSSRTARLAPGSIVQDIYVDRIRWHLHIPHNRTPNEAVANRFRWG